QFSVLDLELAAINRTDAEGEVTNILSLENPLFASGDQQAELIYDLTVNPNQPLDYFGYSDPAITEADPENSLGKEIVFALGADEVLATFGTDQTVSFENLDHLAHLEAEDFLTISLFNNNDAGNVLWEWAFEYLLLEPIIIGYEKQTDSVWYVTADNPEVDMKATVVGYAYRDEAVKEPVHIRWYADGDGRFDRTTQESKETGIFDNKLMMLHGKGARADISVELSTGERAVWKTVEVLAGAPRHIFVTTSGQAVSMDQGEVRLDVLIYDQYFNRVEDGTAVDFDITDSFLIKEQQLETVNGEAYIVLAGGEFTVDDALITITSGEASKEEHLSVQGLNVELVADTVNLYKKQTVTLTATVTKPDGSPAVDVPVSFSATNGLFATNQEQLSNGLGIAQAQYSAGLNEHTGTWVAQVGYVGSGDLAYTISSRGAETINALDAMLVGDESSAGEITFDAYGVSSTLGYETQGTVDVRSETGTTVTIGDMADPNLEPMVSLAMNELVIVNGDLVFEDAHQLNNAKVEAVTVVRDHPLGAGRSALFTQTSRVSLNANSQFNLGQYIGFRLDIKPRGNGSILTHAKGAYELAYSGGTLTYTVKTDTDSYSLSASGVTQDTWHRIATRVSDGVMELYVDGQIYSKAITGTLSYTDDGGLSTGNIGIQLGGLEAVMRGFRLYDWSSQPLVSFEDGTSQLAIDAGSQTLTIKSLGNLGGLQSGSLLDSLRIAVISGDERNYISVLTKRGYQKIALKYLSTVSPQSPYAFNTIENPLDGLVPTAYAWTWGGVWDGVKSGVGYLIPYEDFIEIGRQLVYLMNKDWENFSASKLAFASLGAATILPVAKPLKPLLKPLKRFVDGFARFPAARHFAGSIGTAVKAGLSGKTDKLANLLPFVLIGLELYEDPEVFEFIMNAIENEDDLWVWVDVIADTVKLEGGIDELTGLDLPIEEEARFVQNPLSWVISNADAATLSKRQRVANKIIGRVKKYSSKIPADKARKVTEAFRSLKAHKSLRNLVLKSGNAVRYMAAVGGTKIRQFLRNSKKWRVNRWFVLFAIAYLSEEYNATPRRLEVGDERKLLSLIAAVFSNNKDEANGAIFQLCQVAYYHAMNQLEVGPKVLGVEQERPAYYLIKGEQAPGEPYKRRVDIVLEAPDNGEEWVEVKSLSKTTMSKSKFKNNPFSDKTYYRQFFHDLRLNQNFITTVPKYVDEILPPSRGWNGNKNFTWWFQQWKNTSKGIPPEKAQESRAQEWLCY
ncbi:MAG: hypothetical protein PVF13_07350, partial [Chromatiales bacterium]